MGRRGPLPAPNNVRVLRGMRPAGQPNTARPPSKPPRPPDHLGDEAKKEWKRIAPLLAERGHVGEADRVALALYCSAWATVVMCERELQTAMAAAVAAGGAATDALVEVSARSGIARRSMLAQLAAQSRRECAQHLAALALSPTARARLPEAARAQLELPGVDPMEKSFGEWAEI